MVKTGPPIVCSFPHLSLMSRTALSRLCSRSWIKPLIIEAGTIKIKIKKPIENNLKVTE